MGKRKTVTLVAVILCILAMLGFWYARSDARAGVQREKEVSTLKQELKKDTGVKVVFVYKEGCEDCAKVRSSLKKGKTVDDFLNATTSRSAEPNSFNEINVKGINTPGDFEKELSVLHPYFKQIQVGKGKDAHYEVPTFIRLYRDSTKSAWTLEDTSVGSTDDKNVQRVFKEDTP